MAERQDGISGVVSILRATLCEPTRMMHQNPHSAPVLDTSTELAFARTRAAYERTMMSWIRTATSLITFGFSIYKFFQIEADRGLSGRARLVGPREFALLMVVIGLVALVTCTLSRIGCCERSFERPIGY